MSGIDVFMGLFGAIILILLGAFAVYAILHMAMEIYSRYKREIEK